MEEFEISSVSYQNADAKLQSGIGQIQQQQQQQQQQLQQNQSQTMQQQQQPSQQQPLQQQISQYGFHQSNTQNSYQKQSQIPIGHPYAAVNQLPQHPFGQQPVHTNSTSSSGSSIASHGLSTPGVSDIPKMTSTAAAGFVQGVSPGSSTGIAGVPRAAVSNIHRPIDADSGYCIDWCPNRIPTPMMVVGLGKEIGARVSFY